MICDASKYKEFLNVPLVPNPKDAYWNFLLRLVDSWLKNDYIKQNLEQQISIIEYYGMLSFERFSLKQRPVIQIRNLWYDPLGSYGQLSGSFDPVLSLLVAGSDYILVQDNPVSVNSIVSTWVSRSGTVILQGGQEQGQFARRNKSLNWTLERSYGTIKVEYDAGYPVIPDDLVFGVCMLTRALERIIPYGGVGVAMSESTAKYSYSLQQMLHSDLSFERLLRQYRGLGMEI